MDLGLLRGRGLREAVASGIAITVAAVPEGHAAGGDPRAGSVGPATDHAVRWCASRGRWKHWAASTSCASTRPERCPRTGCGCRRCIRSRAFRATTSCAVRRVLHRSPTADRRCTRPTARSSRRPPVAGGHRVSAHLPFRSGRSFSASVSGNELTVKGAPEVVLAASKGVGPDIEATVRRLAAEGLRVIAVARRQLTAQQAQLVAEDERHRRPACGGLSLAGFLGLSDTPRAEAPALLAALAEQDIGIRLITGDHPITAMAIAREMGMSVPRTRSSAAPSGMRCRARIRNGWSPSG